MKLIGHNDKTCIYKYICIVGALFLVIGRFFCIKYLSDVFSDEQIILDHINAIIQSGYNKNGYYLPLYSEVGSGYATYVFMYPMCLLCKLLGGATAYNTRLILQTVTIVACILIAYAVKTWSNSDRLFWITLYTGLSLPWGFVQASRIWDPAFVPLYFAIFFLFFSMMMNGNLSTVRTNIYAVIAFVGLVFLAIVYPPCRIPAVAMWIYCLIWSVKAKKLSKQGIILVFFFSTIFSIPLAYNILFNPPFNNRSVNLLVFKGEDIYQEFKQFVKNIFDNFSPTYLFITGDKIDRHSLPWFGVLGIINIFAFLAWLRKKYNVLDKFIIFSLLFVIISSALTNEYHPHTLRSCLAWPLLTVLVAEGWEVICARIANKKIYLCLGALMAMWYLFFCIYYCMYYR